MRQNRNTIYFNAGLGNQLFQFAYSHLIYRECQNKVPYMQDELHRQDRPFELKGLIKECSHLVENHAKPNIITNYYRRLMSRIFRFKIFQHVINSYRSDFLGVEINPFRDRKIQINRIVPKLHMGYFQHWNLVEKSWVLFSKELLIYLQEEISLGDFEINMDDYILIHVRRGDLINQLDSMGALSAEYYLNGLKKIENNQSKKLIVVTDDLTGAQDVIKVLNPELVYGPLDLNPWQTLKLMSSSSNFICANSTLSWWGAYLSTKINKNSHCIIPDPWLKNWPQAVGEAFAYSRFIKNDSIFLQNVRIPTDFKYTS